MEQFHAAKPIYMQIADKICKEIVRGDLKPGEKLLSVREMAVKTGVNPNTIQRTYSELERMTIVETKRGQGTFVAENKELKERLKVKFQHEVIGEFVKNMEELGFTKDEMIDGLKQYVEKGGKR